MQRVALLLAALLCGANGRAALLMTEAFDYNSAAGNGLNGLGGWTAAAQATIQDGNLAFPGLSDPAAANSKKVQLSTASGAHFRTFNSSAVGSGSIYVSFLVKVPTLPTTDDFYWPILCLDNDSNISPNTATGHRQVRAGLVVYCQRTSATTYALGVRKNEGNATSGTTAYGTASFTASDTVLVVAKYTFGDAAGDDTVTLWLNPASLGGTEDASPSVAATTSANASDSAALQYVVLVSASPGNGGGVSQVDNIRVGTAWADVTPSNGLVQPPMTSTNRPYITEALWSSQNLILRGTNGATNGTFHVLATADLTQPLAQWSRLSTNTFDAAGNFDITNPTPSGGLRFFALRLAASSNGVPAVAPGISSHPQNQSAAIGENAQFSVTASGSPPLAYQWYFNTSTPVDAGTNSTLIISGVQSNHAGVYHVVVSNAVGFAVSSNATLAISEPPTNGNYFVSTTGNDSNPGTLSQPFATIPKAVSVAGPGDLIYVRGGTHSYSSTIRIAKSGTAGNLIQLWAYPGEKPVIDFSTQPYGASNRGFLLTTEGNYWHFKGLEIAHAGDNGIKVESSHCIFELLVLHHNGDSGLQIGFAHETENPGANLAAFIEVINCDSYLNFDPDSNGGDADGFAAKLHCGQGIVFTGCRAWENSDDGWDLFETDASVVISNCWTWKSGVAQGNGNGFKLGGNGTGGDSVGIHYAYNCVAFGHKVNGFTQNSHKDGLVVVNCLAFSNGSSGYNFFMEGSLNSGKQNIFRNNASIPRSGTNGGGFIEDNNPLQQNNSWNIAVTVNTADFIDLSEAAAKAPRNSDGSLPTGFARLIAGSDLIDKGVNVGIPFNGTAPDLGAFEFGP